MGRKSLLLKILICMMSFGGVLYSYLSEQNDLTRMRMKLPELRAELANLVEENMLLKFQVETFESPSHLMQLVARHEFGHLKHPSSDHILSVETYFVRGDLKEKQVEKPNSPQLLQPKVVLGAK